MNFVSTGVQEVTRRLRRQRNRPALSSARRAADRAEIELGRHGWEAVREDEAVRPQLEAVNKLSDDVEAANGRVRALDIQLHDREVQRETARREHHQTLQQIEEERRPLQRALEEKQVQLAEHHKNSQDHAAQVRSLEAEAAALAKDAARIQFEPGRQEKLEVIAERRGAIAQRLAELDASRPDLAVAREATEQELARLRASLLGLVQRGNQAKIALGSHERTAAVAIAALVKQIAQLRRRVARIEEKKDPSFLAIGRRLTQLDQPPAGAESQFAEARRQRQSYERLVALEAAWLRESRDADKQDLRIFKFVAVTAAVLVAGGLLLFFRTPSKRDWLPRKTETILSLNVSRFAEGDFAHSLQAQEPDAWEEVWSGLVRKVAQTPGIDVRRQVSRITRALAPSPGGGAPLDYLLVEIRPSTPMESLLDNLRIKEGFLKNPGQGLPIYRKGDLALAQIGPETLAVGSFNVVEELVNVRLGLQQDLKSDDQFFTGFAALDEQSAFRLVTQRPSSLGNLAGPFLEAEVLAKCRAVGLTLDLREPCTAVFVLDLADPAAAEHVGRQLAATPDRVLKLQSAGPNLFIEPPSVRTKESQVEWRFKMTQPAARELLQRIAQLGAPPGGPAVAEIHAEKSD